MSAGRRSGADTGQDAGRGNVRRAALRAAAESRQHRHAAPRQSLARAAAGIAKDQVAEQGRVFVSYARRDLAPVGAFVERLRGRGATVTWDQDFIAGVDFEQAIRAAIDAASCVIVVWSEASAQSPYVRDEAREAIRHRKLIATYLAGFDLAELPIGFGGVHAVLIDNEQIISRSLSAYGVLLREGGTPRRQDTPSGRNLRRFKP